MFEKLSRGARGKMESEPLHWVTVAHGDHKTPGRRQTPFSHGRLGESICDGPWEHQRR